MAIRDDYSFNPYDPPGGGGGSPGLPPSIPPGGGGTTSPRSDWPWPWWAMEIDADPQAWEQIGNGTMLHRSTGKIYDQAGQFLDSTYDDYIAENPWSPPPVYDEGDASPDHPGLVRRNGFWYDPSNGQYYTDDYQKRSDPNVMPPPGVPGPYGASPGAWGPPGTLPPGSPDPGDGPVYGPSRPPRVTDYIGIPPPSNPGGGGSSGNPMPGMPTQGVASNPAYLNLSRSPTGQPVGAPEAFKPWGQPMGHLSQALRYGGPPQLTQAGGFEGLSAEQVAALSAALRSPSS